MPQSFEPVSFVLDLSSHYFAVSQGAGGQLRALVPSWRGLDFHSLRTELLMTLRGAVVVDRSDPDQAFVLRVHAPGKVVDLPCRLAEGSPASMQPHTVVVRGAYPADDPAAREAMCWRSRHRADAEPKTFEEALALRTRLGHEILDIQSQLTEAARTGTPGRGEAWRRQAVRALTLKRQQLGRCKVALQQLQPRRRLAHAPSLDAEDPLSIIEHAYRLLARLCREHGPALGEEDGAVFDAIRQYLDVHGGGTTGT